MGIRSYFSQINTRVSTSIREMSDATHPQRTPRARREIAKAVSEALERRLLFVAGPTPSMFTATPPTITTASSTPEAISVTYTATTNPVSAASIKRANLIVTGPGSLGVLGTGGSATATPNMDGATIVGDYVVNPPAGGWTYADDGTWNVTLATTVPNAVADTMMNPVSALTGTNSFMVNIPVPPAPTAAFTPPAPIVAQQQTFTFTVVYTDTTNPISAGSVNIRNVIVRSPTGVALQVVGATPTPNTDNNTISVVYTVDAPTALGFGPSDTGTYTVSLAAPPNAVTDDGAPPTPVAAGPIGTFAVNIVDLNAPIPTLLQNFDITEAGQLSKQIVIEYTDQFGVDPTTITTDNISVVSATGTALVVTSAVANSTIPIPVLQATYTVAKADGTAFTAADNGTYTISINPPPLSPANVSGVHVAAVASFGVFVVDVPDQIAPMGVITAPDITTNGVATETITAVLTDNVAVRVYTIHPFNLIVVSPSGEVIPVAQVIGLNQPDGSTITVQFIIDAPNGTFTSLDNGVYSISLTGVTDTSGNFMPEADGSFVIDIPGAFVPNFSLGTFAATKGQNKLKFRDAPDGTVGIITIRNGTGEAIQEGTTNAIDLVLNDVGKGVDVTLNTSNGRPITINNVFVHGTLVNFNAPNANVVGTFYVNGTAEKATFRHLVGTSLTPAVFAASGPIQDLIVTQATTQALILSGANLGSSGLLNQPGDTFTSGQIGSVTLGGQLTTTVVAAGAAPGADGIFGTSDDTSAGTGSIVQSVIAADGTGQMVKFESNAFGIFKFSKKKFTPNPATDPRFVILT